jgi:hypothetical protein
LPTISSGIPFPRNQALPWYPVPTGRAIDCEAVVTDDDDLIERPAEMLDGLAVPQMLMSGALTSEIGAALGELERRTIEAITRYLQLGSVERMQFDFPTIMIWTPRVSKIAKGKAPLDADRGQKVGRWGTKSNVLLVAGSEQPASGNWDEAPADQKLNPEDIPSHR